MIRVERVRTDRLTAESRDVLGEKLVDIFMSRFDFPLPEMVRERVVFRDENATLDLLYQDDELVGFLSFAIELFEIDGERFGVMDAGMYVKEGVRKTSTMGIRRLIAAALKFRLKHGAKIMYVGEAATPISFRHGFEWPTLYPRNEPTPTIEKLVDAVIDKRDFDRVDGDRWRVKVGVPCLPKNPEKLSQFVEDGSPAARFYAKRNPNYNEGEWLVMCVPIDRSQLFGALRERLFSKAQKDG